MNFMLHLLEFILGAASIIAWVTVLGLAFSSIAPKKLIKKPLEMKHCIAMGGIGLFSTLLTLFFLFLAPKMGLGQVQLTALFGNLLSGGEMGLVNKWGGRIIVVTLGVLGSFLYGTYFFPKMKMNVWLKGMCFGLCFFLIYTLFIFPLAARFPGVQIADAALPSLLSSLSGGFMQIATFLLAMLLFGLLVSGIYNQWEEA